MTSQLPPGFVLEERTTAQPSDLPEGFVLERPGDAAEPEKMSFGDAARGFSRSVGQGVFFGAGDEIEAGIKAPVYAARSDMSLPEAYNYALEQERAKLRGFREEHPIADFAGNVAGAVGTGAGLVKTFPTATRGIRNFAQRGPLEALGAAAGVGAVSGGVAGFLSGEGGAEARLDSAGMGGMVGGIAGPAGVVATKALTPVANATGKVLGPLTRKAMAMKQRKPGTSGLPFAPTVADIAESADQRTAAALSAGQFDESGKAFAKVRAKLMRDFPDNYDEALQAYKNGDQALIELYGNQTRTLAKGAAQYPSGKAKADAFFDQRTDRATEAMRGAVESNVSPVRNYFGTVDEVLTKGRAKAAPLYQEAIEANPAMTSPRLQRILEQPAARKALQDTAESFKNANARLAEPDPDMLQTVEQLESGRFGLAALDEVKKRLDLMVRDAKRRADMGNGTRGEYFDLEALRKDLVDEIDNLDATAQLAPDGSRIPGAYAKARAVAGDYIRTEKAMEEGREFHKIDPELIQKRLSEMTDPEKEAFRMGVAKNMQDAIGNQNEGRNPYNAIFGKGRQKERLRMILGPDEFASLEKNLKAEDRIFRMRNEILAGSPSVSKAMAAAEIAAGGADALDTMATGGVHALPRQATVSFLRKMYSGLNDKTAGKVAQILYETDPVKKLQILEQLGSRQSLLTVREQATVQRAYFATESILKNRKLIGAGAAGASQGLRTEKREREPHITVRPKDVQERLDRYEGRGPAVDLPRN